MKLKKKILGLASAVFCAVLLSVGAATANAENYSETMEYDNLRFIQVDDDDDGFYDHVKISGCDSSATEITIPDQIKGMPVTEVEAYSLNGGYGNQLQSINVSEENEYLTSVDGVLFNKDKTELIRFPRNSETTEYVIPDGVKTIGERAFYYCSKLTSITIPDSVTSIGNMAFYTCEKLNSITIGAGITSLDNIPYNDSTIKEINVSDKNKNYSSIDGVLFNKDKTELIRFPRNSEATEYVIPDGVKTIGESAFYYCEKLKSVTFSDSVTTIGNYAFFGNLESITIGAGITSLDNIPYSGSTIKEINVSDSNKNYSSIDGVLFNKDKTELIRFPKNSDLTEYVIPNGVKTIGDRSFNYCGKLTSVTIPDSVTSIGNMAFYTCEKLNSITIGAGITSLDNIPYNDSTIKEINVSDKNKNYSSIDGILFNKDKTELIRFPRNSEATEYVIPDGVKTIGENAFYYCKKLKSVKISDSVTRIGDYAFSSCDKLTNIKIPDSVTSIGRGAFSRSYSDSINYVDGWLISCADNVESVVVKDGTRGIADYAFSSCSNLYSLTIPDSVIHIGDNVFSNKYVTIFASEGSAAEEYAEKNGMKFSAIADNPAVTTAPSVVTMPPVTTMCITITCPPEQPGPTYKGTRYGDYLYYVPIDENEDGVNDYIEISDCVRTTTVITIPDEIDDLPVKSIGANAFNNTVLYGYSGPDFTCIEIPDSVTMVKNYAFANCKGLSSIEIPNGVTSIGNYAFKNCTGLTSIKLPDSLTALRSYTFYGCTGLKTVYAPSSIEKIGHDAFYECTGLETIYGEIGSSIDKYAEENYIAFLMQCEDLLCRRNGDYVEITDCNESVSDVIIPAEINGYAVNSIKDYAFKDCAGLENITIPDSVTSIGENAFSGTALLENQAGIKYADKWVIGSDKDITSAELKDGTRGIIGHAFYNCSYLESITIPDSVISIGDFALYGCDKILSIEVPASVETIGEKAIGFSSSGNAISNFKLWGTSGTAAESYALKSGINFVDINNTPVLSKSSLTLAVGEETALAVKNYDGDIKWMSDDTDIVTVKNGVVKAISEGTANVFAIAGDYTLYCEVTVGDKTVITTEPVVTTKPTETTKPVETTRPVETTKPIVTTAPVVTTKPIVTTRPVETTKPIVTTEPIGTTKPAETTKPTATTKPAETTKPAVTTKPAETTKPVVTTRPVETTRPAETTKPVVTTKPVETTNPIVTTKPVETTSPEVTTEPVQTTTNPSGDIELSMDKLELGVGNTIQLKVKNSMAEAEWFSNNADVATVDKNGNVTAISVGEAKIYAIVGDITLTCEVNVFADSLPEVIGDSDGDGKVNVRDCAFIASTLAKGMVDSLPMTADFNGDGRVNVRDAAAIAQALAKGTIK